MKIASFGILAVGLVVLCVSCRPSTQCVAQKPGMVIHAVFSTRAYNDAFIAFERGREQYNSGNFPSACYLLLQAGDEFGKDLIPKEAHLEPLLAPTEADIINIKDNQIRCYKYAEICFQCYGNSIEEKKTEERIKSLCRERKIETPLIIDICSSV